MGISSRYAIKDKAEHVLQRLRTPAIRRGVLIVAALALFTGLALAIRANPNLLANIDPQPILLCALIAVPLAVLTSALEYDLTARLAGVHVSPGQVLQTTIVGSAANLLPIPGAALVRTAGIRAAGASLKNGATATTFAAALWPATGTTAAGLAGLALGHTLASALLALLGAGALVTLLVIGVLRFHRPDLTALMLATKCLQVAVEVARLSLCLTALGASGDLLTNTVLNMANVIGSLVAIVPAGLGVREGAAFALAPLLALSASLTLLAVAINRILGLAVIAPLALLLAARPASRTIG